MLQLLFKSLILIALCVLPQFDIAGGHPFIYQVKTVVIDAGHGGKDPGCLGGHSREKEIALKIALKLGTYIENNIPEVKVIYTRKKDVFVELDERAKIANDANADLFISIHCNASGSATVVGTETYVMGVHKNDENLNTAKRENSVILLEENYEENYGGYDPNDPATHIAFKIYQGAFLEQSILFASLVEKQFKERAKRKSRGVKQAGLVVLFKSTMPSVLVESGFLTNKSEESYLLSDDGQSYIASAIYRAFKEYKTTVEAEGARNFSAKSQNPSQNRVVYEASTNTEDSERVVDLSESTPKTSDTPKVSETSITIGDSEDPILDEIVSPNTLNYRIQLYSSYDNIDFTKVKFSNDIPIEIEANNRGIKWYMLVKPFIDRAEAEKMVKKFANNGFKNAKIVTYRGFNRIE